MRLVRRTLLCLVVGMTAFGVAGWGLRPKPRWVVDLGPSDDRFQFVRSGHELKALDPVWVVGPRRLGWYSGFRFDADGRLTRSVEFPYSGASEAFVSAAGELVVQDATWGGGKPSSTTFSGFGAAEGDDFKSRFESAESLWQVASDGTLAYELSPQSEPITLRIGDIRSGGILSKTDLGRRAPDRDRNRAAVSRDARLIAAPSPIITTGSAAAFDVYDALSGALVCRVLVPDYAPSESKHYWAKFSYDGRALELSGGLPSQEPFEKWIYRFADRRLVRSTVVEGEKPATAQAVVAADLADEADQGVRISTAYCEEQAAAWLRIDDGTSVLVDWRLLPFAIDLGWKHADSARRTPSAEFIPKTDAVVMVCPEPPIGPSLPLGLGKQAPASWNLETSRCHIRWHNWRNNEWRTAASVDGLSSLQTRPDALLTIDTSDEQHARLQSWPLPPRDPKPPALAIAGAFMAGTWWLCASRYRRRTRLASVGAP